MTPIILAFAVSALAAFGIGYVVYSVLATIAGATP